jgi:lipopolysaccharide transport system permease protein
MAESPGAAFGRVRTFVWSLVVREFRARYLGSALGAGWNVVQPLAQIFVYTIVFAQVMGARLRGVDDPLAYGIFLCAGLLPWTAMAEVIERSKGIYLEHSGLLKHSSFPRWTLPAVVVGTATINFAVIFLVFLGVLGVMGKLPGLSLLALAPAFAIQGALAIGIALGLSALNVYLRDLGPAVSIAMQFWFWLTPIVYPIAVVPAVLQPWLRCNPLVPIVECSQAAILSSPLTDWPAMLIGLWPSALIAVVAVFTGWRIHRRLAPNLADEL